MAQDRRGLPMAKHRAELLRAVGLGIGGGGFDDHDHDAGKSPSGPSKTAAKNNNYPPPPPPPKARVVVMCGETGCGKTTQLPQFILEEAFANGRGGATNVKE